MGGIRLLEALGFEIRKYRMNEGHPAFLAVELLRRYAHPAADLRPGESPFTRSWSTLCCRGITKTAVAGSP